MKKAEDLSRNLSAIEGDRLLEKLDSLDKELQLDKRVAKSKGERAQLEETYNAEVAKVQKEFQDIQTKRARSSRKTKKILEKRASLERKDIIKGVTDDIVQIERLVWSVEPSKRSETNRRSSWLSSRGGSRSRER